MSIIQVIQLNMHHSPVDLTGDVNMIEKLFLGGTGTEVPVPPMNNFSIGGSSRGPPILM